MISVLVSERKQRNLVNPPTPTLVRLGAYVLISERSDRRMNNEYWIITFHPPGGEQIPVGVLALHSGSDTAELHLRSDLHQIASGDDLAVLQGLPGMFADEASTAGARGALRRWAETLSHSVRIAGPFESDASSARAIWEQRTARTGS